MRSSVKELRPIQLQSLEYSMEWSCYHIQLIARTWHHQNSTFSGQWHTFSRDGSLIILRTYNKDAMSSWPQNQRIGIWKGSKILADNGREQSIKMAYIVNIKCYWFLLFSQIWILLIKTKKRLLCPNISSSVIILFRKELLRLIRVNILFTNFHLPFSYFCCQY